MSSVAFVHVGPQNAPKSFAAGGFDTYPTGGAYNTPSAPLAGFKGAYTSKVPTSKGREGRRREGRRESERGEGRGAKMIYARVPETPRRQWLYRKKV